MTDSFLCVAERRNHSAEFRVDGRWEERESPGMQATETEREREMANIP